jgi:response regulator RpfG family c-di-GMP phosphodiesterase
MNSIPRPRVLCVDDEPRVVEGLVLNLRKDYDVHTALSGEQALQTLRAIGGAAVVVCDMRMPAMDGATLLQKVMSSYPMTTRILLTGEAGRDVAVHAVNKGQIFRFLTKPCSPDQLRAAVEAGVIQFRILNSEREMLQETVLGCIKALVDVLALANPVAFGRATRLERRAKEFAAFLEYENCWQLEAAALLSQVGYLSLPPELVYKLYYGEPVTTEEARLASAVPSVAIKLLEHIPRLEPVMQILAALTLNERQLAHLGDGTIGLAAKVLGLVLEYDVLTARGQPVDVALKALRDRAGHYGASLIEKFASHLGAAASPSDTRLLPLQHVRPGMIMAQDVRTHTGTLIVPRGFVVTLAFLEKVANFGPDLMAEKVEVCVGSPGA